MIFAQPPPQILAHGKKWKLILKYWELFWKKSHFHCDISENINEQTCTPWKSDSAEEKHIFLTKHDHWFHIWSCLNERIIRPRESKSRILGQQKKLRYHMRDLLESVHLCMHRGNHYLFYLFTACLNVLPWWWMHMLWKMSITNNKSRSTLTLGNTYVTFF